MIHRSKNLTGFGSVGKSQLPRRRGLGRFGHTDPNLMTPDKTTKTWNGYTYRFINQAGVAHMLEEYEKVYEWTYQGERAVSHKYAVPVPNQIYKNQIKLPDNAIQIAPDRPDQPLFLPWFKDQFAKGKGIIGYPLEGKVPDGPPRPMGPGYTTPYQFYKEEPIVTPFLPNARWGFLITRDIKLVSDICAIEPNAAVLSEPAEGWLLPEEVATEEQKKLIIPGIGIAILGILIIGGGILLLGGKK